MITPVRIACLLMMVSAPAFAQAPAQTRLEQPPETNQPAPSLPENAASASQDTPRQAGQPLPFAPQTRSAEMPAPIGLLDVQPLPGDALLPDASDKEAAEPEGVDIAAPSEEPAVPEDVSAVPVVIEAQALTSEDVAAIGTLTEAESGFSTQIWSPSTAEALIAAWQSAPTNAPSPVIVKTLKSLALTIAAPPLVTEEEAWALIAQRVDVLTQLGDLNGVNALLNRVPNDAAPPAMLQQKTDYALWGDDWATACAAARTGIDRNPSRYWTEITLACHAVEGNQAAVDFLLEVTPDDEQPTDQHMRAISALLRQTNAVRAPADTLSLQPVELANAQALDFAISKLTGTPATVTADFIDAPAIVHASLAAGARQPLMQRWPGLAALAYRARLSPADLVQYAVAVDPQVSADPSLGVMPQALRQPLSITVADQRADALLALSRNARSSGLVQLWATAIGNAFEAMAPSKALWDRAGGIAAHLAFSGAGDEAAGWYSHIRRNASMDDLKAAENILAVWPYALLGARTAPVPFTPRLAQLWWQAQDDKDSGIRAKQGIYFFTALEALGYPIAPEIWATLGDAANYVIGGTQGDVDVAALETAIEDGEIGRGLLLGLSALGENGPVSPDPQTLGIALRALVDLGFSDLARQLAVEVLFFNDVSLDDGQ